MGKNKKATEVKKDDGEEDKRQYKPTYLKNVIWLPEFDGSHICTIHGERFKAHRLFYNVLNAASDAWHKHHCKTPINQGWGVDIAKRKFMLMCEYEMTNVFAQIWLDRWIYNLSIEMYNTRYRQFRASFVGDANKADKAADKAAQEYTQDFLNPISMEPKVKCVDFLKPLPLVSSAT